MAFSSIVVVVVLCVAGFVVFLQMTPFDQRPLAQSVNPTQVYDKNGNVYMTIAGPGANNLPYQDIPQNLQNALVATEDHTFWQSSGVDLRGILRAMFVDLLTRRAAQGASTIQMQLAKMVYLTDDRTLQYKIKELALGVQINRHFTKQEILAMYLNRVFLGENCVGVEQAARKYFGVDLRQNPKALTLTQAALLAGLPQAPSAYDPLVHPEAALTRRNEVLQHMAKYGYITQAEAMAAEKEPLGASNHPSSGTSVDANPLFANFLFDNASQLGISRQEILAGGLQIYTTVDPTVQNAINQVFWSGQYDSDFPASINGKPVEGAAIFVDPTTGGVLGAAGSRKYDYYPGGLDRVYSLSQPGSSIKPIMEYAPAIESGRFTPDSILDNTPQDFGNGYVPQNDAPGQPAKVTLRYALEQSQNVASVWLLQNIGLQTGVQFAENDGIPLTNNDKQSLAIGIGGLEQGVSPYEMAQAYEAFDYQGQQMQEHLITRVVNASGTVVYQYQTPTPKQIMSQQTATVMTQLMQGVVQNGTGQSAQVPGWDVAGKTGTVQWSSGLNESHPDWISRVWFDGYTPNMVGSVYLGYDNPHDPVYHLSWSTVPNQYCARVFRDIVRMSEAGKTPEHFSVPTPPAPTPSNAGTITNLTTTWDAVKNGVQLTWASSYTTPVTYQITRSEGQGNSTTGDGGNANTTVIGQTSSLSYEDLTAQTGVTYTYSVQAIDSSTGAPLGSPITATFMQPAQTGPSPGSNSFGNQFGPGNATGSGNGMNTGNGTNFGNGAAPGSGNGTGSGNNTTGNSSGGTANGNPSGGNSSSGNGDGTAPTSGNSIGNNTTENNGSSGNNTQGSNNNVDGNNTASSNNTVNNVLGGN